MRRAFLSILMQTITVPVLGQSVGRPVDWVYGGNASKTTKTLYAPQLRLACTLTFREEISTERDRVYLEDLADCKGPAGLCHEISTIEVSPSPKPGLDVKLLRSRILDNIREEYPQHTFDGDGPEAIRVKAIAASVDLEKVRAALDEKFAEQTGNLRFSLQSMRSAMLMRLRHQNYHFEFPQWDMELKKLLQFPRRTLLTINVKAINDEGDSPETFSWPLQLSVRAELLTLVPTRSMARGSLAQAENFEEKWLPYQENTVHDKKELNGKSLRISVREGQALRIFELMQEPDVRRGEKIEAAVFSGGVKMNSPGQAMETGVVGQKIRVQIDTTKRQLFGTIIAKSKVEVQMP